ncbi:MAG: CHC2 zinc finger domain-containing protein [Syntrophales bacterium]
MTTEGSGGLMGLITRLWKRITQPPTRQSSRSHRVTDRNIEAARRVNLVTLIESLGYKATWHGSEKAMFSSPLREENNPSFSVSYYKGRWTWKDWGSGESGDVIKFVKLYYGIGFLEAVKKLTNGVSYATSMPPPQKSNSHDYDKVEWVRNLHKERMTLMTSGDRATIRRYFEEQGVRLYDEMACVMYTHFKEKKSYVAIPITHADNLKGLECREIGGTARKTLGHKTLWVLRRQSSRIMVAESILDALASEIILNDDTLTLCSLNGVGNAEKIGDVLSMLKPREILFALDNDEPGRAAQRTATKIAARYCDRVIALDHHVKAGVKDMHKLITRQPARAARAQ